MILFVGAEAYRKCSKGIGSVCLYRQNFARSRPMLGGSIMYEGFFESEKPAPKAQQTSQAKDERFAVVLANFLRAANRTSIVKLSAWTKQFKLLRKTESEKEIEKVLAWFMENIKHDYIPFISNALQFRQKFTILKKMMGKDPSQVEIGEEARDIMVRLRRLQWPGDSLQKLPGIVQKSLDNYKAFYKRLLPLSVKLGESAEGSTHRKRKRLMPFLAYLTPWRLSPPVRFTLRWFEGISVYIEKWSGFSGNMEQFIWTEQHERFHALGYEWAFQWAHDQRLWTYLMEELKGVEL